MNYGELKVKAIIANDEKVIEMGAHNQRWEKRTRDAWLGKLKVMCQTYRSQGICQQVKAIIANDERELEMREQNQRWKKRIRDEWLGK